MLRGKEIYLFFGIYGINGIIGIIFACGIIGFIINKVIRVMKEKNIDSYYELMEQMYPKVQTREVIKIIINIFLLISFYIMVAGFSAYFTQELGMPNIIGTIIIILLSYFVFMGNIESVIKVNTFLIPLLIAFIVLLGIKNTESYFHLNQLQINTDFLSSTYYAILYGSYNTILLVPILASLKKYITNRKQIRILSLICTVILGILAFVIFGLLIKSDIGIQFLELPTVYVAGQIGTIYKYVYGIIILVAILTSALSAGYGILENYLHKEKTYKKIAILMCTSALFVSNIGFSNLINSLYPIFGLLGLIQILLIMKIKLEKKR